jgi:hypothetical protein
MSANWICNLKIWIGPEDHGASGMVKKQACINKTGLGKAMHRCELCPVPQLLMVPPHCKGLNLLLTHSSAATQQSTKHWHREQEKERDQRSEGRKKTTPIHSQINRSIKDKCQ